MLRMIHVFLNYCCFWLLKAPKIYWVQVLCFDCYVSMVNNAKHIFLNYCCLLVVKIIKNIFDSTALI